MSAATPPAAPEPAATSGQVSRATFWTLLDFVFDRGANFIFILALARLLTPEQFGLVALLAVFVAVANVLSESGLGLALVQKETVEDDEYSAAFWMNLGISVVIAAIIVFAAPAIAAFFRQPALAPLARIMALVPVFVAFGIVQRARLLRAMQFRRILLVRVTSTLVAGLVAVALVLRGYGAAALAAQAVVLAFVDSTMMWAIGRWQPRAVFSIALVAPLVRFGGYLAASAVLDALYTRAYAVVLGRARGVAEVGNYARADSAVQLAGGVATQPVMRIALPFFSRLNGNREEIAVAMRSALQTAMLINAPVMLGLAALAEPFMLTVYGPQWAPAAPILAALCLGNTFLPMHVLNLHVLLALGQSKTFFWLEILKKAFAIAVIVFAVRWGAIGVAWAAALVLVVTLLPTIAQLGRRVDCGIRVQLATIAPILLLAGAMAGIVAWFAHVVIADYSPAFRLVAGTLIGIVLYGVPVVLLDIGRARFYLRRVCCR